MTLASVISKYSVPEACLKGQPKITTKKSGYPIENLGLATQRAKENRD
jgi:hypothetical protein